MPDNWWESSRKVEPGAAGGDDWWKGSKVDQTPPKIRETTLSQGKPESAWHHAWASARDAVFGTPEHQEAYEEQQRTGVNMGIEPPPSKVYGSIAEGVSMLGGGPAALAGTGGVLGRIGTFAAEHPKAVMGLMEGAPDLLRGDYVGALKHGARGVAEGAIFQGAGKLLRHLGGGAVEAAAEHVPLGQAMKDELRTALTYHMAPGIEEPGEKAAQAATAAARDLSRLSPQEALREARALVQAGKPEEARAIVEAQRALGRTISPGAPAAAPAAAPEQPPLAIAPSPAPTAAPVVPIDRGRQAAQAHADMMALGKQAAESNPKIGEKIWIRFKDGKPIGVILDTEKSHAQDIAGAVNRGTKRTGESAVFIKNLWGRPSETPAP